MDFQKMSPKKKETMPGILRVDCRKPRRSLGSSGDLRDKLSFQRESSSPQPSVDRLSVTFAEKNNFSESTAKVNILDPGSPSLPKLSAMDKVRFCKDHTDGEEEEEDDYSASVSVILQRRESMKKGSSKKKKRRASSPLPDTEGNICENRRRSSEYTNSSGNTSVSIDIETTQEQIFENIRLHKEVLSSVKLQPWGMRRKIKLVQQAKAYVKRHEGELQERLAMSKSTKDILARFNIWLIKKLQYLKRELANTMTLLIPWELRIKEIESHFGSAVASYFTFLRWMFWVNFVITVVLACFVAIPEMLTADVKSAGERKEMLPEEKLTATHLVTLWDFGGVLKYSPIFYGYYTNQDSSRSGYRLPFAYFMTGLAVYVYSFIAILRRMAENSRMSKLSEKDDECIFTWKIFTGWDYMIGNAETAHNRVASLIMGFKEALLEETERKKDEKNWKVICLRVLVSFIVIGLLAFSAYIVFIVVERSKLPEANDSWWRQNETTVSVSIISLLFPLCFELLGLLEGYHPRKSLRIQLARIMVLNLLNLYTLIFSLFWKISDMTIELQTLKKNYSSLVPSSSSSTTPLICLLVAMNCSTTTVVDTTYPLHSLTLNNFTSSTSKYSNLTTATPTFEFTSRYKNEVQQTTNVEHLIEEATESSQENDTDDDNDYKINFEKSLPLTFSKKVKKRLIKSLTNFFKIYDDFDNGSDITQSEMHVTNLSKPFYDKVWNGSNNGIMMRKEKRKKIKNMTEPVLEMGSRKNESSASNICYVKECKKSESGIQEENFHLVFDMDTRRRLRSLCWETMFGQELVKLTVMDLMLTVLSILLLDFFRAIFVRVMNNCWCWDLEKKFPQYGDFKIAENILHLVYNQGMVWMGMFFSPGLPAINLIKLAIMMYLRSWAVLTCNVPHEVVFRASRSNNFYLALLLMMLFLCVLPVGFAIVWIEPSWHCGPFSDYEHIYHFFTTNLHKALPKTLHKTIDYIASPGIIIPLLMLLVLIIYYLVSLTNALREANNDLKIQLRRERTEERRKMFQLVTRRARKGSRDSETPFAKWKKLLPELAAKQINLANEPEKEVKSDSEGIQNLKKEISGKELLGRLIKKSLKKSTGISNDEGKVAEADGGNNTFEKEEHQIISNDKMPDRNTKEIASETDLISTEGSNLGKSHINDLETTKKNSLPDSIPEIRIIKTESDELLLQDDKTGGKARFKEIIKKYMRKRRAEKESSKEDSDEKKVKMEEQRNFNFSDRISTKEKDDKSDKETEENKCPLAKEEDISTDLD